jgi:hypothetical protein
VLDKVAEQCYSEVIVKKILAAAVALAIAAGAGLVFLFGPLGDHGGGEVSAQPLVLSVYAEGMGQGFTCDDIREIVNPAGAEKLPAVVAVVEAPDIATRLYVTGGYLLSHMIARAKIGQPFADEGAALNDIEDGYILYIAAVKDGLGVSEEEARAYLEDQAPRRCDVTVEGATESDTLRTIQIERSKSRIVQKMLKELKPGEDVYQVMATRIAQERPSVKITEVAFGAAGGLECNEAGHAVPCPPDILATLEQGRAP